MTTYKEIRGTNIEVLSSDPSNPIEGQVWYNSTSNVLKGSVRTTAGAWATGGTMNTGRRAMSEAGIQTAALGFGGSTPGPTGGARALTESYNGTNWTELNDINSARGYGAGAGTSTSALMFGGSEPPVTGKTETWNGTNWTETTDLNQARYILDGAGASNTSALAFAGAYTPPYSRYGLTELWNGSNWTEVNDMNTARDGAGGFGTQTSALVTTGEDPSGRVTLTETWNGTNWTEVNDTNANRNGIGAAGADNTAGIIFGGFQQSPVDANVGKTETWNGTNWTEEADLSGPVYYQQQSGAGTSTAALSFGGEGPANQQRSGTEEWTGAGASVTRTFTDS